MKMNILQIGHFWPYAVSKPMEFSETPVSFGGFWSHSKTVTVYNKRLSVRRHFPPTWGDRIGRHTGTVMFDAGNDDKVTVYFCDEERMVTDLFYGICNDYNEWFVGKAARNEKFDIFAWNKDLDKWSRVEETVAFLGDDMVTFEQNEDMTWRIMEG